jgi:hypothetical protein
MSSRFFSFIQAFSNKLITEHDTTTHVYDNTKIIFIM